MRALGTSGRSRRNWLFTAAAIATEIWTMHSVALHARRGISITACPPACPGLGAAEARSSASTNRTVSSLPVLPAACPGTAAPPRLPPGGGRRSRLPSSAPRRPGCARSGPVVPALRGQRPGSCSSGTGRSPTERLRGRSGGRCGRRSGPGRRWGCRVPARPRRHGGSPPSPAPARMPGWPPARGR